MRITAWVQLVEEDAKGDIVESGDQMRVSRTELVGPFLEAVVEKMKLKVGPQTLKLYTEKPSKDESKKAKGSREKLPDSTDTFYVKAPTSAGKRRQRFL